MKRAWRRGIAPWIFECAFFLGGFGYPQWYVYFIGFRKEIDYQKGGVTQIHGY